MGQTTTFNRTAQARRIRAMKPETQFTVATEEMRQAALKDAQSFFRGGVVEFRLKTWANVDGSFTIRAVKP